MKEIIGFSILSVVALASFVLSILQFCCKGFLLNNAYIYASKKERETMDKKPYYRQSGVVFLLIGIIFSTNAIAFLCHIDELFSVAMITTPITLIYAIISSVVIEQKKQKNNIKDE